MLKPLTSDEQAWVESILAGMSLEEKVGHLLCPEDPGYSAEEWEEIFRDVPLGSVFVGYGNVPGTRAAIEAMQANSRIPVLIASDLEHGAGAMITGCTRFPFPMALGATGDVEMARAMGRATAREGRAYGVHWTFSPVVDLNLNFQNPVTNIRSLGDDPEQVSRMAAALIEGLQDTGELAATAKHFPGDGVDDRDQHICTSINSLAMPDWWASYGRVWKAAIEAGVMSIMVGHIALPDYCGLPKNSLAALPATLEPRLQIDLLRGELGFQGLIVSDAAPMIGIASRVRSDEEALQIILAGSDVYLFADPRRDFQLLMEAVRQGRLTEARVEQSVRRVLEMKARLGLHWGVFGALLSQAERDTHWQQALTLAEKSITLLRKNEMTPVRLPPGAKVLTATVRYNHAHADPDFEMALIDEELRKRGLQVDHLDLVTHQALIEHAGEYDCVFVNIVIYPHARMGTVRLTGELIMTFWKAFFVDHPNVVFTAFGSPYLLYELPHLPNLYLAYSHTPPSRAAAVRAWLGEIEPCGKCPVKQPIE
jgi:beta-N-acetylhexosaminidase